MHKHYRNFICDICDADCHNISGLKVYKLTHDTGSFNVITARLCSTQKIKMAP